MITKRFLPLIVALLSIGCDNTVSGPSGTPTSGSSSTTTSSPITESFEATLSSGESTFYSFNESSSGAVMVTLASVVQPGKPTALATPMHIALGTPVGEGCEISDSIDATPALTPQLTVTLGTGIHCVSIGDSGQLTGTVIVSIRFVHR